ncbi:hypothetical protein BY996DRAFT_116033 [Phakopsora pachyrhizi]|nr:hypothetical protein BY996DRAFT_116033 [Phakopsora pachyrhizi]
MITPVSSPNNRNRMSLAMDWSKLWGSTSPRASAQKQPTSQRRGASPVESKISPAHRQTPAPILHSNAKTMRNYDRQRSSKTPLRVPGAFPANKNFSQQLYCYFEEGDEEETDFNDFLTYILSNSPEYSENENSPSRKVRLFGTKNKSKKSTLRKKYLDISLPIKNLWDKPSNNAYLTAWESPESANGKSPPHSKNFIDKNYHGENNAGSFERDFSKRESLDFMAVPKAYQTNDTISENQLKDECFPENQQEEDYIFEGRYQLSPTPSEYPPPDMSPESIALLFKVMPPSLAKIWEAVKHREILQEEEQLKTQKSGVNVMHSDFSELHEVEQSGINLTQSNLFEPQKSEQRSVASLKCCFSKPDKVEQSSLPSKKYKPQTVERNSLDSAPSDSIPSEFPALAKSVKTNLTFMQSNFERSKSQENIHQGFHCPLCSSHDGDLVQSSSTPESLDKTLLMLQEVYPKEEKGTSLPPLTVQGPSKPTQALNSSQYSATRAPAPEILATIQFLTELCERSWDSDEEYYDESNGSIVNDENN